MPVATSRPATTVSTFDGGGFLATAIGLVGFEGERLPVRVDELAAEGPETGAHAGTTTADVNAGDARADTRPDPRTRRTDPNAGSVPQTHPEPHDS